MTSIDIKKEFEALQARGKKLAAEGRIQESLHAFEAAKIIFPTPKVLQRIEKLKSCMASVGLLKNNSTPVSKPKLNTENQRTSDNMDKSCFAEPVQYLQKEKETADLRTNDVDKELSQVKILYEEAKNLAKNGKSYEALEVLEKAQSFHRTEKVQKLIDKLKSYLASVDLLSDSSAPVSKPNLNAENQRMSHNMETSCFLKPVQDKETADSRTNDEDKLSQVKILYEEAKNLATNGKSYEALEVLEKAQSIYKTEKVQKQIDKLKEFLVDVEAKEESNDRVQVSSDFSLHYKVYNALYAYQKKGVAFLYNLFRVRKGGILADDMGLGKTFQIIAFLSGMIDLDFVKHVLIVMPVSLLKNWEREFKKWCPGIAVSDFHGDSKKNRERNLLRVQKRGHVLLTTYGMILNNVHQLSHMNGREFVWDYLILDEGHKIKNASKTTKAVHDLPSKNRIVLTGTPIQNNLRELWSLFNFVHQGTLLGSLKTFKTQYENPIVRSREKDATSGEKQLGAEISENLKDLINPYFLRRTKAEISADQNKEMNKLEKQIENMIVSLPKKNDLILWTFMSEEQIKIYKSFLHSDAVKEILVSKRSPLVELTVLKKICDHPRLLSREACSHMGLGSESQYEDDSGEYSGAPSIDGVTDEMLLLESGKMNLVICLIQELKETGHRALVFSSSRKILDIIQRILMNRKFKVLRLDGTITKTEERERRIQKFQGDSSYSIFLLTTQVGGVGINLTAADRVIIYDPSWNPATDAQAVDRVFRIGQKKKVIVYRLITCGTVEEKIYRRQIFKDSITRQTTGDNEPYRYFSKQELRELFTFEDPYCSVTQAQLHQMHAEQRQTDEALLKHIEFLQSLNMYGISDHDLMFSKEVEDHIEDNDETAISKNFIKAKVAAAQELITKEASVAAEEIRITGTFNRPYQEPVGSSKPSSKVTAWYKPPALPDASSPDRSYNRSENTPEIIILSPDISSRDRSHNEEITPEKRNSFKNRNFDIQRADTETKRDNAEGQSSFKEYENEGHRWMCQRCGFDNHPALEECEICQLPNNSDIQRTDTETKRDNAEGEPSFKEHENDVHQWKCQRCGFENHPALEECEICQLPNNSGLDDLESPGKLMHSTVNKGKDCRKNGRVSCARQSGAFLIESEDEMSKEDSSNSASLSFVPDSATNSPEKSDNENHFISEIPPSPELPDGNTELGDFFQKHGSNVRRITPLKVDKSFVQENNSFVQAMASSRIITPQASPEAIQNTSLKHLEELNSSPSDSPVYIRKKRIRQINSESDEDYEVNVTPKHGVLSDSEEESENKGVESVSTVFIKGSLSASKMVPKSSIQSNSDVESDDEIKTDKTVNLSSEKSLAELTEAENEIITNHSVLQETSHISDTSEGHISSPHDESVISVKNDSASASESHSDSDSDEEFQSENDSASLFSDDSFE